MDMGEVSTKQLISVALMIMFAFAAMFFIGYKFAYDKAIRYANNQIEEKVNNYKMQYNIGNNPDFILGNIEIPDFGGQNDKE